jgi:protein involved in polysaccharide export with SLBB domain
MTFSNHPCQKCLTAACCGVIVGLAMLGPAFARKPDPVLPIARPEFEAGQPVRTIRGPMMESLKPTSAVILTHAEFDAWWSNLGNTLPGATSENNLVPVSLQDPILPHAATQTLEPMPKLKGALQWVDYTLKIGDVLSIQLLGHPELSQKGLLISPDGVIDLPLVGTVMAAGVSMDEMRQELARRFGYYLRHPDVTVSLEKVAPLRAYVMGSVKSPGIYLQEGQDLALAPGVNPNNRLDYRLSALLAKSGGILGDADLEHIKIFNTQKGRLREANILNLLAYGDMAQDMLLEPEDVVYVPRLPNNQWSHPEVLKLLASSTIGQSTYPVRVYGLVTKPDVYQLSPADMTLQSVLAKAGIDVDKASRYRVYISRTLSNRQMQTLAINSTRQDTVLYPNDVVIVSYGTWEHQVKKLFSAIGAITGPAANVRFVIKPGVTP